MAIRNTLYTPVEYNWWESKPVFTYTTVEAISPSEIAIAKANTIPREVVECINELIALEFTGTKAVVKQKDIIARIKEKYPEFPFDYKYLNVEELYQSKGWLVFYNKPAYNEDFDSYFVFRTE